MAVDPRFQGSGLARDMVASAIEQMKSLGVRRAGESADVDEILMVRFLD